MSIDAQDEPVPESLPIGRDVRTTDVADDDDDESDNSAVPESLPIGRDVRTTDVADDDDDESDNSEMGLEDREGLDDVESDNSSNGGNNYDQDSDDYED
jgi:hypothetical protein